MWFLTSPLLSLWHSSLCAEIALRICGFCRHTGPCPLLDTVISTSTILLLLRTSSCSPNVHPDHSFFRAPEEVSIAGLNSHSGLCSPLTQCLPDSIYYLSTECFRIVCFHFWNHDLAFSVPSRLICYTEKLKNKMRKEYSTINKWLYDVLIWPT